MGIGNSAEETPRRAVSIGFVKPTLEGNAIYVQLRQKDGDFSAEAISEIPFNFCTKTILGYYIYMREKRADSSRTGHEGMAFIEMIVQQNNGQKEFRGFDDSYRMLGKV